MDGTAAGEADEDVDDLAEIERELRLLRAGGPRLLREAELAGLVGLSAEAREELHAAHVQLRRFEAAVVADGDAAEEDVRAAAFLDELRRLLCNRITNDELRGMASRVKVAECTAQEAIGSSTVPRSPSPPRCRLTAQSLRQEVARHAEAAEIATERVRVLELELARVQKMVARPGDGSCESVGSHVCQPDSSLLHASNLKPTAITSAVQHNDKIKPSGKITSPEDVVRHICISRWPTLENADLRATLGRALDTLARDVYDSSDSWWSEILQNADDCRYPTGVRPNLYASVSPNFIALYWNECGMTAKDVRALTDLGMSTKVKSSGQHQHIGCKGLGFKSVFAVSQNPAVISNGYSFAFDLKEHGPYGALMPLWQDRNSLVARFPLQCRTRIIAADAKGEPFTALLLPLTQAEQSVQHQLHVEPATLVFLRRIEKIEVSYLSSDTDEGGRRRSWELLMPRHAVDVTAAACQQMKIQECESDKKNKSHHFLVWHSRSNSITLAFPQISNSIEASLPPQPLFCHLPVCSAGLPFALHARFELTASRQTVRLDSHVNRTLIHCAASEFAKAITHDDRLRDHWFCFVPPVTTSMPQLVQRLISDIIVNLRHQALFKSECGNWFTPNMLVLRPRWLRKQLLTTEQLALATDLNFSADSDHTARFGVRHFTLDDFLQVIESGTLNEVVKAYLPEVLAAVHRLWSTVRGDLALVTRLRKARIFAVQVYIDGVQKVQLTSLSEGIIFRHPGSKVKFELPRSPACRLLYCHALPLPPDIDEFLKIIGCVDISIPAVIEAISARHLRGAGDGTIKDVFTELQWIKEKCNILESGKDELAMLQSSILLPAVDGSLRSARDLFLPSFLGLLCHCSNYRSSKTDAEETPQSVPELPSMIAAWGSEGKVKIQPAMICVNDTKKELCHWVVKHTNDSKCDGATGSCHTGRGKCRVDFITRESEHVQQLLVGFAIESTIADSFGDDAHGIAVGTAGNSNETGIDNLLNIRICGAKHALFSDACATLHASLSPGSCISALLDLDSLTAEFALNGQRLFISVDNSVFELPLEIFADSALLPYVRLSQGSVGVCFARSSNWQWMDDSGYVPLSLRYARRSRKQRLLSDKAAAIVDIPHALKSERNTYSAHAIASWEAFYLAMGCRPHHHACTERSFFASTLLGGDFGDCAICYSSVRGREGLAVPDCGHTFHKTCLLRWLDRSRTCPICRGYVNKKKMTVPEPSHEAHLLSELLQLTIKSACKGATVPIEYSSSSSRLLLQCYSKHTFTLTIMRRLRVLTTLGPRSLETTFLRSAYMPFGGNALPYLIDCPVTSEVLEELKQLGIACEPVDVVGIVRCITNLKNQAENLSTPQHLSTFESADFNETIDVVAACYGELWRLLSQLSPDTEWCRAKFASEALILTGNGKWCRTQEVVWDIPKTSNAISYKRCPLRKMYGSLRGLFVSLLKVPNQLLLDDYIAALNGIYMNSMANVLSEFELCRVLEIFAQLNTFTVDILSAEYKNIIQLRGTLVLLCCTCDGKPFLADCSSTKRVAFVNDTPDLMAYFCENHYSFSIVHSKIVELRSLAAALKQINALSMASDYIDACTPTPSRPYTFCGSWTIWLKQYVSECKPLGLQSLDSLQVIVADVIEQQIVLTSPKGLHLMKRKKCVQQYVDICSGVLYISSIISECEEQQMTALAEAGVKYFLVTAGYNDESPLKHDLLAHLLSFLKIQLQRQLAESLTHMHEFEDRDRTIPSKHPQASATENFQNSFSKSETEATVPQASGSSCPTCGRPW